MGLDIFFRRRKNTNAAIERAMEKFYGTIKESTPISEVRKLANELGIADRLDIEQKEYNGTPYVTADRNDSDECGYMRKHNHLVSYFGYEDNCSDKPVSREALEAFVLDATKVLEHYGKDDFSEVAENLVPCEQGFFFGSYDYDEWYKEKLEDDIRIFKEIISGTDWNSDIVVMHCWW